MRTENILNVDYKCFRIKMWLSANGSLFLFHKWLTQIYRQSTKMNENEYSE